MMKTQSLPDGRALAISFADEVTQHDLEAVVRVIDVALEDHEKVNVLIDLVEYRSLEPRAFLEELLLGVGSFGLKYRLQRIAVIAGALTWESLLARETTIMPGVELRSFPPEEKAFATHWVQQPIEMARPGVILTETEQDNMIRIQVKSLVTGHDMRRAGEAVRLRYEQNGPVRLLTQLEDRPASGPGLSFETLRAFDRWKLVARHAVVAPAWARHSVELASGILRGAFRYFPLDGIEAARLWLCETGCQVEVSQIQEAFLTVRLSGRLNESQLGPLHAHLQAQGQNLDGRALLLELPYDPHRTLLASLEAIRQKLSPQRIGQPLRLKKLAVVTDVRWCREPTSLERPPIPGIPSLAFPYSQREVAEDWLANGK